MSRFIGIILIAAFTMVAFFEVFDHHDKYSGLMPEIVVTAPRYSNKEEIGMMPEIVVTAPRYLSEKDMGMMPEIVVIAARDEISDLNSVLKKIAIKRQLTQMHMIVLGMRIHSINFQYLN